jgi:hypothetical protein
MVACGEYKERHRMLRLGSSMAGQLYALSQLSAMQFDTCGRYRIAMYTGNNVDYSFINYYSFIDYYSFINYYSFIDYYYFIDCSSSHFITICDFIDNLVNILSIKIYLFMGSVPFLFASFESHHNLWDYIKILLANRCAEFYEKSNGILFAKN